MIVYISYGTEYIDKPILDGVDKLIFCQNCKKPTIFAEYYGQKHSLLYGASIGAIGDKKYYLKCTKCKEAIYINNEEIGQLREDQKKLKKILDNVAIKNDNIFYSREWHKKRITIFNSRAYFDLLLDGNYLYVIKIPEHLFSFISRLGIIGSRIGRRYDERKRESYRLNWVDENSQLKSRLYNNNVYLKIPIRDLKKSVSYKGIVVSIEYDGIKIRLTKTAKDAEEFFWQTDVNVEMFEACKPILDMAYSFSEPGQEEKAIEMFDNVLDINSENIFALQGKAFSLLMLGREKETLGLYNEILEINPENEMVRNQMRAILADIKV